MISVEMLTQGRARGDGDPELLPRASPWAKILSPVPGSQRKQRHPAAGPFDKCPISRRQVRQGLAVGCICCGIGNLAIHSLCPDNKPFGRRP
jgi:hypothetical protein